MQGSVFMSEIGQGSSVASDLVVEKVTPTPKSRPASTALAKSNPTDAPKLTLTSLVNAVFFWREPPIEVH